MSRTSLAEPLRTYTLGREGAIESPTVLPYEIESTGHTDVDDCEFFIREFGFSFSFNAQHQLKRSIYAVYQIKAEMIDRVETIGAYLRFKPESNFTSLPNEMILVNSLPHDQEARSLLNTLVIPVFWQESSEKELLLRRRDLLEWAFFIDILKADLTYRRLWISNGGRNFSVQESTSGYRTQSEKTPGDMKLRVIYDPLRLSPIYRHFQICHP